MTRYIFKRLLLMIPTLLGVAVLVFVLLRVLPGDVVEIRFASGQNQFLDQKMLDAERAKLGLDKPLWQQFVDVHGGAPPVRPRALDVDGLARSPRRSSSGSRCRSSSR